MPGIILAFLMAALIPMTGLEWGTILNDEDLADAVSSGQINFLAIAGLIVSWGVVTLWIFVSWHRFILLEEYPQGWIPKFRADRIGAYFLAGLRLLGILLAMMMVIVLLAMITGGIAMLLTFVLGVIVYRFVAILPAAAIGQQLTLGESWNATLGATGSIIVMMILFFLLQIVLSFVINLTAQLIPAIGIASQMTVTLFMSFVNVSVMTTFYGHYVEKRKID
ncbi:MAG: hypothetical protein GJ676_22030 [Rhodobacteraceae bacterium]|nr:hypothetical protein [Paracoccaceae bacterium]